MSDRYIESMRSEGLLDEGDDWRCPRCGSPRWVAIAHYPGGPRVRQCVPCGRMTSDAVPEETT